MKTKHTLIGILFFSFMMGNILFNSVFTELFLDILATDELVVEHEVEEEKEMKDFYFYERKNIKITPKINTIITNLDTINSSYYRVYIDILSPPPELNNYT